MADERYCKKCARKMDINGAGKLPDEKGQYPENWEDRKSYVEWTCYNCKVKFREETQHTWSKY